MENQKHTVAHNSGNKSVSETYDAIIIGGSYAGLSAAMSLGRALRKVLVIDSGQPCNRQTPHSHNFLTRDGESPNAISRKAKEQVVQYDTVRFHEGLATEAVQTDGGFEVATQKGDKFRAKKIVMAAGVKDMMPEIEGFAECWGISVLHCPYCHGYEVRKKKTGILARGEMAFELAKLISQWTNDLTLFTGGPATLTGEQTAKLKSHNIAIVDKEIASLQHADGYVQSIRFSDGTESPIEALYARAPLEQHSTIPASLGCELTETGLIKTDLLQKTSVAGVYACGDSTTMMRSVASAVATGNMAGAAVNKDLIDEQFSDLYLGEE